MYFRLNADFLGSEGHLVALKGRLAFLAPQGSGREGYTRVSFQPNGWGVRHDIPIELLDPAPAVDSSEFATMIQFYMAQRMVPPNLRPVDDKGLAGRIVSCGNADQTFHGHLQIAPKDRREGRAFMRMTQGGVPTGEVLVLIANWCGQSGPSAYEFSICDHKPVEGIGANPSRGWRPARCPKCDLDMSVDSGD